MILRFLICDKSQYTNLELFKCFFSCNFQQTCCYFIARLLIAMAFFNTSLPFRYVILPFLKMFASLTCYMMRQLEVNDLHLQAATGRVPPSWGPEHEKGYSFRFYEADALLWCLASDMDEHRKGPALALRLTGAARMITREIDPNTLSVGAVVDDGGQQVQLNGVRWLLRLLSRRYAPLDQEAQLHAVSEFFAFTRLGHEDTDQCIARFEVCAYRAEHIGHAAMNQVVLSWMLLHHMRIPRDRWPLILAQTNGNLPSTPDEYQQFLMYLRRNGHLYDRTGDPAKNVSGFLIHETEESQDSNTYTYASYPEYSTSLASYNPQTFESTFASYEDWQSASSGNSNDEEAIDLSDLAHLPYPQAVETAYMGFRTHKRRWRKFAGPRKSKGAKKGHKGPSKGSRPLFVPGKGKSNKGKTYFGNDGTTYPVLESDWYEPPQPDHQGTYVMGKGKGRRSGNPVGRDGKQMLCSGCNSPDHFIAVCPQKGKGKGTHGAFVTEESWPKPVSSTAASPPARGMYLAVENENSSAAASDVCTILFSDGRPAVEFNTVRERAYFTDNPSSSQSTVRKQGFFPWWEVPTTNPDIEARLTLDMPAKDHVPCYHSTVRLSAEREGVVVDTAAVTSIAGDAWVGRSKKLAEQYGHGTSITPLARPFGIEGVGKGSNDVTKQAVVPIALASGVVGAYTANMVEHSNIPALLGLEPLIKQRTLLDLQNGKLILLGEGGYQLKLSPGSAVHNLERSPTGHLMLPTSEWKSVNKTAKQIALLSV